MGEIIASQVGCYALELTLAYLQIFALKSTLNLKKKSLQHLSEVV